MKVNNIIRYAVCTLFLIPFMIKAQELFSSTARGNRATEIVNPHPVMGKTFYNFICQKDIMQPDNLYTELYKLNYSKSTSLFSSYSKKLQGSSMRAEITDESKTVSDPNHVDLVIVRNSNISNDQFFTALSTSTKVYALKTLTSQPFEIIDTQSKVDWKILDSTKMITGNLCQEAVAESHARRYSAWFCCDLSYSFEPRKLNGLPGLILKTYHEKRQVVYILNRLQNNFIPEQIGLSENNIIVTQEGFNKASDAFKKNPQVFMSWHPQGQSAGIKNPMDNIDASKIRKVRIVKYTPDQEKLIVENNPIDLK